jgi:hypothetical protein
MVLKSWKVGIGNGTSGGGAVLLCLGVEEASCMR